jgi:hypothetical protein
MFPSTVARVPDNTAEQVNEEIRRQTKQRVARISSAGAAAITRRLEELDEEWDIERILEMNAASLTAVGAALTLLVDRRFAVVPLLVGSFLVQHATQGWCPPLPILRRYGYRTLTEIDEERYALKALRGDFEYVGGDSTITGNARADRALQAVNA